MKKTFINTTITIIILTVIMAALLIPQLAYGQTTIYVPGDYASIQAAIDAATDGDTIEVAAGTYNENIIWSNKNLTIQGAGADVTFIDGSGSGSVLTVSGLSGASTIDGFTITNGSAANGGGIYMSSPINVSNCVITGNTATTNGGGIYVFGVSPTITNCTFSSNTASSGGAIYNRTGSNPTITNCILWGDTGGEIGNHGSATPVVTYCDVQGGYAGTGNINIDPSFVGGGDYSLASDSPCIDAGNPASSVPTDGGWYRDMGVFEYTGTTVTQAVTGTGQIYFGGQVKAIVDVTTLGTLSQITMIVYPAEYYAGTEGDTVQRWYDATFVGNGTFDVTLTYTDSEIGSETEGSLVLWSKSTGDWVYQGGTVDTGQNTVTVSGLTDFGDWVIADNTSGNPPVPEMLVIVLVSIGLLVLATLFFFRRSAKIQNVSIS